MRQALIAVFIAILLAGCASRGTPIDRAQVDQIEPGITTYSELVDTFGNPASTGYNQDGEMTATWFYVYVGAFGSVSEQQILAVLLDSAKFVKEFNLTTTDP